MTLTVFKAQETQYMSWLSRNRRGYVLTTVASVSPAYMSLHRSTCRMISHYMKNMANDAFTGQRYIKVCSNSPNELLAWVRQNGGTKFTKLCSFCQPEVGEGADEAETYRIDLDAAVAKARRDSRSARRARLAAAPRKAETFQVSTTLFRRNPDVIAEVLERANGVCEGCGKAAPFRRASNDTPYLEVHHKTPLAENGDDTDENAIALCPNCHRKAHFGAPPNA